MSQTTESKCDGVGHLVDPRVETIKPKRSIVSVEKWDPILEVWVKKKSEVKREPSAIENFLAKKEEAESIVEVKQEQGDAPKKETAPEPTESETESKGKMKKWPDKNRLVDYEFLFKPIKDILEKGYRLTRKTEVKSFEYDGYNIGKKERKAVPNPRLRFTERFLEYEKTKRNKSLFDVAMNVMFLLGMEQGRRAERIDKRYLDSALDTLHDYRNSNKTLRLRVDMLEAIIDIKTAKPDISEAELDKEVASIVQAKRFTRMEAARKELQADEARSTFSFHSPQKASFNHLKKLAESIDKTTCGQAEWKDILRDKGWHYKEWKSACKKKNFTNPFTSVVVSAPKAGTKQ